MGLAAGNPSACEGEGLHPGDQVPGQGDDRAPDLVGVEVVQRQVGQPTVLGGSDAVLGAGPAAVPQLEVASMQRPESQKLITPRQHVVLCHLSQGLTAAAIAHRLGLSARTVEKHLENLYRALGARDRLEAVLKARDHGLLPVLQGCEHLTG
jgi:DNA-binding CsgD family transcriptional regulator